MAAATSPGEVSQLLVQVKGGNQDALAKLIPLVYTELRHLAGHYLRNERIGHTLQPTALVHEVYLRMLGQNRADWQNRAHFIGVAARMMRRILVNYARERRAGKRSPAVGARDVHFERAAEVSFEEILAVDEALGRLSELDPRQSRLVEMRYFGGLSEEEIAEVLSVSTRTVKRDWATAKACLKRELSKKEVE